MRTEHSAAIEQVTAAEKTFEAAQADVAAEKAKVMRQLDEVIATAKRGRKTGLQLSARKKKHCVKR